mgnify:CR=1 FL=1
MTGQRLVSIAAAQGQLGDVSRTAVYRLIRDKHLKKVNVGRRAVITQESLDAYIESLIQQ